eukprot:763912-Hanusia_phi.AAC.3
MSFNMLAQCYTRSEFFPNVQPKAELKWNRRGPKIVDEILRYSPDIVCLQECDCWSDFMLPRMQSNGFVGIWKQKTGKKDGVAILWKTEKFKMLNHESVEYNLKGGVGIIAVLQPNSASGGDAPPALCVANTHLFWNPEMEYVKLKQAQLYLNMISSFAADLPLVVCGDLNSMPGSDCYSLFVKGRVTHTYTPVVSDDEVSGQVEGGRETITEDFSHPLTLSSAYDPPLVKNSYHMWWLTLDTKAFSTLTDVCIVPGNVQRGNNIRGLFCLLGLVQMTSSRSQEKSLPSSRYPSDHMACMACMAFNI